MAELTVKYTTPLPDGFTSGVLEIKRPQVYIDSQGRKAHAYHLAKINPDRSLTEMQTGLPLKIIAAGPGDPAGGELDWVETLVVEGLPEPLRQTDRIPAVYTAAGEIDLHRPNAAAPLVGAPNDAVQQAEEAARQAEEARRRAEAAVGRLETAEEAARRAEAELRAAVDALRDYAMDGRLEHAIQVLPGVAENQDRIDALLAQMQADIGQFPGLLTRQQGLEQVLGRFGGQLADAEDLFEEVKRAYQVVLDAQSELSQASRAAADARDAAQRSAQEALDNNNRAAAHAESSSGHAASAVQAADVAVAHASAAGSSAATATAERQKSETAAGEAGSQATIAREQATASATSAEDASTAAQAAESARLEAGSARDGAAQSASAALTSQQQASSSADAAGQAASAARGSSLTAESAASSAAGSAATASGHAVVADQRATAALQSMEAAQSSATAAGQSASAAQASSLSAEASRGAAVRIAGNPDFAQGLEGWTAQAAGTEAAVPPLTESAGVQLVALAAARGGRVLRPLSQYMTIGYRRPVPVDPARTYRLTVRARRTVDQGRGAAGIACLDAEGRELARRVGSYFQNWPWNSPAGEWDTKTALYTGTGDAANTFPAGTVFVRPYFYANLGAVTNELDYLLFEDVTSETAAGGYAAASGQSASAASASATDAGKQAQAAQSSRVAAETAQGNAQGAAAAALESKQAAAGSASAAGSSASNAASSSEAARLAKVAAEDARTQSQGSAAAAAQSASQASSSQTAAQQSAQASESSRVAAVAAQGAAETAKGQAANSAAAASTQAQAAQASAGQAGQYATAAETSRQSAATAQGQAEAARNSAAAASDKAAQAQQQASSSASTAQAQAQAAQGSAVAAAGSAATAKTFMQASITAQAFQPKYSATVPAQKDRLGNYWMPHFYDLAFEVQPRAEGMGDNPHISMQLPQAARYAAVAARVFLNRKPENAIAVIWGANGGYASLNLISTVSQLGLYTWHTLVWDLQGPGVEKFDGFNPGDPISKVSLYFHDAGAEKFLFGLDWLAAGTISAEPQTSRAEFTQYVDSLGAETVLKVQSGGVIAGIGLRAESGTGSAVNILADRFVVSTAGGARQPFIVTGNQVAIDGNLIATGTVSASKITTGTLDASVVKVTNLNAGDIVSGYLSANRVRAGRLDSTNNTSYLDLDTGAVRLGSAEGPNLTYSPAAGFSLKGGVIARANLQPSALGQILFPGVVDGNPSPSMYRTIGGRKSALAFDGSFSQTLSTTSWTEFNFFPQLPAETGPFLEFTVLMNFQSSGAATLNFMDSKRYFAEIDNTAYYALVVSLEMKAAGAGSVALPARAYPRADGKGYEFSIGVNAEGTPGIALSRLSLTMLPGRS